MTLDQDRVNQRGERSPDETHPTSTKITKWDVFLSLSLYGPRRPQTAKHTRSFCHTHTSPTILQSPNTQLLLHCTSFNSTGTFSSFHPTSYKTTFPISLSRPPTMEKNKTAWKRGISIAPIRSDLIGAVDPTRCVWRKQTGRQGRPTRIPSHLAHLRRDRDPTPYPPKLTCPSRVCRLPSRRLAASLLPSPHRHLAFGPPKSLLPLPQALALTLSP